MKLLNCLACQDIVRLNNDDRPCQCGRSSGHYVNAKVVEYAGPARIMGMRTMDYHRGQTGVDYVWWFIGEGSNSIRKREGGG